MPRQFASAAGAFALLGIYILAWLPASNPSPADKLTLLFLAVAAALTLIPGWRQIFLNSEDAATFGLLAVGYVLFQLADRAGPENGPGLKLAFQPDAPFVFSFAWYLSVLGAILSAPAWIRKAGPAATQWVAMAAALFLGGTSFVILKNHYAISVTDGMDPTPMVTLIIQIIGYGSLALCCRAAALDEKIRRGLYYALPAALLVLWARHFFVHPPAEDAE